MNLAYLVAGIAVMGPCGEHRLPARAGGRFASPFIAAERGYVDDVLEPRQTRPKLIGALRMLANKVAENPRKKHGCIPL